MIRQHPILFYIIKKSIQDELHWGQTPLILAIFPYSSIDSWWLIFFMFQDLYFSINKTFTQFNWTPLFCWWGVCMVIFTSNPTEDKVDVRLGWGFDFTQTKNLNTQLCKFWSSYNRLLAWKEQRSFYKSLIYKFRK